VNRRRYTVDIVVNGHNIKRVIIDPHYELKHSQSMNDFLILELVSFLNEGDFIPEHIEDGFEYYVTENISLDGKHYRLIWLIEQDELFIGVINAFRRK